MTTRISIPSDKFSTFGELLKYLRRRAGLTQRELSIAVGYSEGQISRLEQNQRWPDLATLSARFVPALYVEDEPTVVARMLELAAALQRDEPAETERGERRRVASNLPLQLTSFIGRTKEMAEIQSRLATARLVTLTGPGGVGKTRLALQVAANLVKDYPDGVWWVELASISSPAFVPLAVGSALNLLEEASYRSLADYLRPKSLLLIFDNCEHVIAACAHLAEGLLQACPDLKILTSSREGLGVAGEAVFHVPSLTLPDVRHLPAVEDLAEYEAIQLFMDRAAAVTSGFRATDQDVAAIAQLCHRLDGIPLAIELAAARVSTLTVQQIAARLDNRFRLLTGGSRTAVPRHQTLSALIGWSYELLSEAERALLKRLSVFSGGWTLEAAEAICADREAERGRQAQPGNGLPAASWINPADLLDLLTQLVQKSLVIAEREPGQETRYRLLETIQQYASERLLEAGDGEPVRSRHLEFFAQWVEAARPEFRGPNQLEWFNRIEAEHDNLRTALVWSHDSGQANADLGLRLATALAWFWYIRGYWGEGRAWLEQTLTAGTNSPQIRAWAVGELFYLTWCQGDTTRSSALLAESFAASQTSGDKPSLALALVNQAEYVNWMEGDFDQAEALLAKGLALYRELGPAGQWGYARGLMFLGETAFFREDYTRAAALLEESLALFRRLGDRYGQWSSMQSLGAVVWRQEGPARATVLLEESLVVAREIGFNVGIVHTLNRLGRFKVEAQMRGDHERAEALIKESLAMSRDMKHRWGIQDSLRSLAKSAGRRGWHERGARLLGAVDVVREELGYPPVTSEQADYEAAVAASRARLGEAAFAVAWAEGRAMTLEQAVEYALEEAEMPQDSMASTVH